MLTFKKLTVSTYFGTLALTFLFQEGWRQNMGNTFKIGRRFQKIKYFAVVMNCLVVCVFYFIYRFLLEEAFPKFVEAPLVMIFIALIFCVGKITIWAADRYAGLITYTITENGLLYRVGTRERLYPWEKFTAVRLRASYLQGMFPVEFQVGNETLMINQYVDGVYRLTGEIFRQIQAYVNVDQTLIKQAKDMEGVY